MDARGLRTLVTCVHHLPADGAQALGLVHACVFVGHVYGLHVHPSLRTLLLLFQSIISLSLSLPPSHCSLFFFANPVLLVVSYAASRGRAQRPPRWLLFFCPSPPALRGRAQRPPLNLIHRLLLE
jgi:hypothetical protein